jgi:hypothetical protein
LTLKTQAQFISGGVAVTVWGHLCRHTGEGRYLCLSLGAADHDGYCPRRPLYRVIPAKAGIHFQESILSAHAPSPRRVIPAEAGIHFQSRMFLPTKPITALFSSSLNEAIFPSETAPQRPTKKLYNIFFWAIIQYSRRACGPAAARASRIIRHIWAFSGCPTLSARLSGGGARGLYLWRALFIVR